jgi:hypothetical protein
MNNGDQSCVISTPQQDGDDHLGFEATLAVIMMIQLFQPCMNAQEIESTSEEFVNDVMESAWVDANLETKKMLLTFMQHLLHPTLRFNLFGIVDANLKTFLRVSLEMIQKLNYLIIFL